MTLAEFLADPERAAAMTAWQRREDTQMALKFADEILRPARLGERTGDNALFFSGRVEQHDAWLAFLRDVGQYVREQLAIADKRKVLATPTYAKETR